MKNLKDMIFKIQEDMSVPGTDIILEKGDKIQVIIESIASTIKDQIGRGALFMMGVKQLTDLKDGLGIRFTAKARDGINYIEIKLNAMDLYDLRFIRIRGMNVTVVYEVEGIYFDNLHMTIYQVTGLALSL